MTILRQ
ncbi:hypothetical protein SAMN05660235_02121 [Sporolituus thermophilus DSM 23256]|nr:hypothetical protein SAMN05660235_02121 [Sporolituus thermophilus DSM 23256]